jgi:hypothetical protein
MGDLTEGLELRCSQCREIVHACSVCGAGLGVGGARCAMKEDAGHHHESCDAERRRRILLGAERTSLVA